MILFCFFRFDAGGRINVDTAELLAAFPTPGLAAASSDDKGPLCGKAASKNVITGSVFEAPSLTPGTLFGVVGHGSSTASYKFMPPIRTGQFICVTARLEDPYHRDL